MVRMYDPIPPEKGDATDFPREQVAENEAEVRAALRRRLAVKGSARKLAVLLGLTEAYISQLKRGQGPVPPKIAYVLGYERVVTWRKIDG
jgi:transcriptional regulator with XRE-family HTH domain